MADFQFVHYRIEAWIGRLRLNRPPVNALNSQLVSELHAATHLVNRDAARGDLRVLILCAEGKHFCAGADLKERMNTPTEAVEAMVTATRNMMTAIAKIEVPVIAAVHGSALGGGAELALAADLRILAESAQMGLRETALAIIPGAGGTQRLPRLIGRSAALLWIATGRVFSAPECFDFGVANWVVPDETLESTTRKLAEEIAANGPIAIRAAKEAVVRGLEVSLEAGLEIERQCYAKTIATQDRVEALRAFNEKRQPRFQGK